jgi:four helix bundle protein
MKENVVKVKSFAFAVRIINLYRYLIIEKKEYVIAKQILKSGTSVGACIRESENAKSRVDFIHKLSIAQKEINETLYWLELLNHSQFIEATQFESLNADATEIIKLLTSIIRTMKQNLKIKY